MRFAFHPLAEEELDTAVAYYEECQVGLGIELAEEVYAAIGRISEFPNAWSKLSENTRRCLVNRFPYGVVFQIEKDLIRIIAVANLRRKPEYWKDRL